MKKQLPKIGTARRQNGATCLAIHLGESWRFWRLQDGQWITIDKPDKHDVLWRVCDYDWIALHGGRSHKGMLRMGRELVKDRAAFMKVGRWGAFTREATTHTMDHPVRPFALAFRDRLEDIKAPTILRTKVPGDYTALAVYQRDGSLTGWTLSSEEDIEVTGQRLAQNASVADATFTDLPDAVELLTAPQKTRVYPSEREIGGIPVSVYRKGVVAFSVLFAVLSAAYWFDRHQDEVQSLHQLHQAQSEITTARSKIRHWDIHHVDALAHRGGINPVHRINIAESVYIPGGKVSLVKGGDQLIVELPNITLSPIAHGQWTLKKVIKQGLARKAPKGWRLKELARRGNGHFALIYIRLGGNR